MRAAIKIITEKNVFLMETTRSTFIYLQCIRNNIEHKPNIEHAAIADNLRNVNPTSSNADVYKPTQSQPIAIHVRFDFY